MAHGHRSRPYSFVLKGGGRYLRPEFGAALRAALLRATLARAPTLQWTPLQSQTTDPAFHVLLCVDCESSLLYTKLCVQVRFVSLFSRSIPFHKEAWLLELVAQSGT